MKIAFANAHDLCLCLKTTKKAAEIAAVVQKEIFKVELGDADTLVYRAKETRGQREDN